MREFDVLQWAQISMYGMPPHSLSLFTIWSERISETDGACYEWEPAYRIVATIRRAWGACLNSVR